MASTSVKDYILYYKNKLDRFKDNEDMILETIHKLAKPTVTAEIVQDTGILRYLHKLSKRKGRVADTVLPLFNKWKLLLTYATNEKDNLKRSSPPEEKPNLSTITIKLQTREGDQSARSSHPALDPSIHPPRSRDIHPDRGIKRKDPFPPVDPKRPGHHSHRERDPKHHPPLDTKSTSYQPDTKSNNPHHHRSSDSDSDRGSRHQPAKEYASDGHLRKNYPVDSAYSNPRKNYPADLAHGHLKKDYSADSAHGHPKKDYPMDSAHGHPKKDYPMDSAHGNPRNPKRELEDIPHQGSGTVIRHLEATFKLRKEVVTDLDGGLSHHSRDGGSRSFQRDPIMEVDGRHSDSRHPGTKKDYFAAEADTTCPGSRSSEHNGVSNSQDSNHIDIDSLSNPNLSIETTQAERLNTSDDSEPATPTKRAKTLEPYYIEMREGMFRAVKNHATPFSGSGLKVCEQIHRDIIKGNIAYKKEREKYDDYKSGLSPPKEAPSSDGEKCHSKNGPLEQQKPSGTTEKAGRYSAGSNQKHDLKRKSASPCKGGEKKMVRPDSTSDHKLKIKKEVMSPPSHLSKPLNNVEAHQSNCDRNKKLVDSPETSAMQYISSKKDRRAVYSGRKTAQDISSLKSCCFRVLRKNLDCFRCAGKVPYETLLPFLETLNPSQLSKIEEYNQHLLPHTNGLWKQHYNRDYRSQTIAKSEKDVVWKEEYNRAHEQQDRKLKNLRASFHAAASKAKPDRQAKLTIIDSHHDFGRRGTRTPEVPIPSSRCAVPSVSPAIASRPGSSPTPKASSSGPRPVTPITSKPKEIKHSSAHKPVKKVIAPLMSKVKKSMAVYRQK